MPYLSNTAVNRLNIHMGLHMLAWNLAGGFFLVFLMSRGFSPAATFLIFAAQLVLRFIMRPIILMLGPRLGLHRLLLIGNGFFALQYLCLAHVTGLNASLFIYLLAYAAADIFYWASYHAIFATLGDAAHRGKQLAVRQALATVSAIFAPLLGGWLLQHQGPIAAFGLAAAVQVLAAMPLLNLPPIPMARQAPPKAFRVARDGALLFVSDGWISTGLAWAWGILLFGSAHHNFATFGVAAALGGFVSAAGNLILGRLIDTGKNRWIVLVNAALLAVALILRAASGRDLGLMFAVTAASSLLDAFYMPTLMTAFYNIAKAAPCPLRFMFICEGAWDTGGTSAALAAALLLYMGAPAGWTVGIALLAVPFQAFLLRKYYTKVHLQPAGPSDPAFL